MIVNRRSIPKGGARKDSPCPIARGLDAAGQWWSMLILRDAFYGISRFDEFERSLGIAPTMLTRRLADLVKRGLLERRRYCAKPPRYEYQLTQSGADFWPVIVALLAWGNQHLTPEGASVILVDRATGRAVEPVLVDAGSGKRITSEDHMLGAGPKAIEHIRRRAAFTAARRGDPTLRPDFLFE